MPTTKFEEIGIGFQEEALSVKMADDAFKYSCHVCTTHGMAGLNCDTCGIAVCHQRVVETLQASEVDAEERKLVRFQEVGIQSQHDSYNVYSCEKAMKYSCRCCANKELKLACEDCLIKKTHLQVKAAFEEEEAKRREIAEQKRKKQRAETIEFTKDL